jgi:dihydroflavonol-4-reductase
MRAFVTGGAGFIGREVVRQLRERGDEVIAVIRNPDQIAGLRELGAQAVSGDLGSVDGIRTALGDADAVIHSAGSYRVGIPARERPQMYEANVAATRRVLDAAIAAATPRIVHVSTVNAFGNTRGVVRDETYRRDPAEGFVSCYDETKYLAHVAAETRMAAGDPVLIVQPGQTYGPGDHSWAGAQLRAAYAGTARMIAFGGVGMCFGHVSDLASGILMALDKGRLGQAYVLCGEPTTLREAMTVAARVGGRRPPRIEVPDWLMRATVPMSRLAVRLGTMQLDMAESVRAAVGVTYWASHAKATDELGWVPRPLGEGVVDAFGRG